MSDLVLDVWHSDGVDTGSLVVLPDGCRDVIVRHEETSRAENWFLSDLYNGPFCSVVGTTSEMSGFRLRAGTQVDLEALLRAICNIDPFDRKAVFACIHQHAYISQNTRDALHSLSEDCLTVNSCARQLGVSMRSLQRLIMRETGRAPGYWRQLARIRRAGRRIESDSPLAEFAFEQGYSDQAHMTRAFSAWFGMSPKKFSLQSELKSQLGYPAYG